MILDSGICRISKKINVAGFGEKLWIAGTCPSALSAL